MALGGCAEWNTEAYWGTRTEPFAEMSMKLDKIQGQESTVLKLVNPTKRPLTARVECPDLRSSDLEVTVPPASLVRALLVADHVERCKVAWE